MTDDLRTRLGDEHWLLVSETQPGLEGGCPTVDRRVCLEGVPWMIRCGSRCRTFPPRFSSRLTVHRRFVEWASTGEPDRA
ncbi:transposase [Botrimarina sp.]|uniref:transposase n=1 Tax=Botrimarina sp. TaxID=2795802 RepID=UPI0032EF7695